MNVYRENEKFSQNVNTILQILTNFYFSAFFQFSRKYLCIHQGTLQV